MRARAMESFILLYIYMCVCVCVRVRVRVCVRILLRYNVLQCVIYTIIVLSCRMVYLSYKVN